MAIKEPPIEKVYEAWGAVADGRVDMNPQSGASAGSAVVTSSDRNKSYKVTWRDGGNVFTSTDPATFWQGYPGYPVIAVLMALGRLPLDDALAAQYRGINWTQLNAAHRRDYAAAVAEVNENRGIDAQKSCEAAQKVAESLKNLKIVIKRK